VPAAAGSPPSDGGGAELLSKRAPPWSFLLASTQYVCGVESYGILFPLPAFQILGFEGSVGLNGRSRTLLSPVIRRQPAVWWHCLRSYRMQVVLLEASLPASPSGVTLAPGSMGAMHPQLPRPYLPGSSDSAFLPVNWRRVESDVELVYS
jgi:hypothetical protein